MTNIQKYDRISAAINKNRSWLNFWENILRPKIIKFNVKRPNPTIPVSTTRLVNISVPTFVE